MKRDLERRVELISQDITITQNNYGYVYEAEYKFDIIYRDKAGFRHISYDTLTVENVISIHRYNRTSHDIISSKIRVQIDHLGEKIYGYTQDNTKRESPTKIESIMSDIIIHGYDLYVDEVVQKFMKKE